MSTIFLRTCPSVVFLRGGLYVVVVVVVVIVVVVVFVVAVVDLGLFVVDYCRSLMLVIVLVCC